MINDHKKLVVRIADLILEYNSEDVNILFDRNISVDYYCVNDKSDWDFKINYHLGFYDKNLENQVWDFVGHSTGEFYWNYSWFVNYGLDDILIKIEFKNHNELAVIFASFNTISRIVDVKVIPKNSNVLPLKIDPFINPLGSLLLLYFLKIKGGLLLHASAVINNNKSYVFTGVSGIGKSTMFNLWKQNGYDVINDDRVVIRLIDGVVKIYNNPMPYYRQEPRESVLDKVFLLKQSPENYSKELFGAVAFSRVMGNFIQQFFNKEMVKNHLEYVEEVLSFLKVYELGFKPDVEIIDLIKSL